MNNWLPMILLLSFFLSFLPAHAATPPNFKKAHLLLTADTSYFFSDANFSFGGGSYEALPLDNEYSLLQFDFNARYNSNSSFAYLAGLSVANAKSTNVSTTRTNTAVTEAMGGLQYRLPFRLFNLILESKAILPFERIEPDTIPANNDQVIASEGATQFIAGFWLNGEILWTDTYVYLAYNFRDEGRAHLALWNFGISKDIESFTLGGELHGFETVKDDQYKDSTFERTNVTNTVNANSLAFYSVNPAVLAANVWVELPLGTDFSVRLGYDHRLNGDNYAAGQTVFASLRADLKMDTSESIKDDKQVFGRKNNKEIEKFEVESETYDEKLFKKNQKKKRRKRGKSNKQLLDEVEKSLEN